MRRIHMSLGLLVLAGVAVGGCTSPSTPAEPAATMPATTMPAATMPAPTPTKTAAGPAAPMGTVPKAKDLTHVLTVDEPYYAAEPAAGAAPSGTLKSGSKVLLMVPGAKYSEVTSDMGMMVYIETAGLKALGK